MYHRCPGQVYYDKNCIKYHRCPGQAYYDKNCRKYHIVDVFNRSTKLKIVYSIIDILDKSTMITIIDILDYWTKKYFLGPGQVYYDKRYRKPFSCPPQVFKEKNRRNHC